MCGIIAVHSTSIDNYILIKNTILESQIRGKHATGISYIKGGELITLKTPLSSHEFVNRYWQYIEDDLRCEPVTKLIAHTRYSTSDLEYNQPIADNMLSVVMNGVITQSDPSYWDEEFGVTCITRNDTEIAHIKMKHGINPMTIIGPRDTYPSMAIASLTSEGIIDCFRNGRRPAYNYISDTMNMVVSTREIIKRALVKSFNQGYNGSGNILDLKLLEPGIVYRLLDGQSHEVLTVPIDHSDDWQGRTVYEYDRNEGI